MDEEKEQLMREQLDSLYAIIDDEHSSGLNTWEQMAFDIYCWILEDGDEPDLN